VYVIRCGAAGADNVPTWTYNGGYAGGAFGNSVSCAGDVNGDGYSDLLIGEVFGDAVSTPDCGHAYVYLGAAVPQGTPYATINGQGPFTNLGQAVAGGGDVNGDGFGDLVVGEPRAGNGISQEGSFRFYEGNARAPYTGLGSGRGRPVHAARTPFAGPIAVYGASPFASQFGLAGQASSAGGRDEVALDWRVTPPVGGGAEMKGHTPWSAMHVPTDPLGGAAPISALVYGLDPNTVFGWKTRVLSRSPWFRYGAWTSPQPNGRLQWDVRTHVAMLGAPTATLPAAVEFAPVWPNPSQGAVDFAFALPRAGRASLRVLDLQGRPVRTLLEGDLSAGPHALAWDGTDHSGRPSAAGMYFAELRTESGRISRRIVRTR
jgi:hypothetical protein